MGGCRYRAALLGGLKDLQVIVCDRPLSDSEVRLIQLTENMHRADLSGHEKSAGLRRNSRRKPDMGMKDLAENLHLDLSMVTRLLSPSKCSPACRKRSPQERSGSAIATARASSLKANRPDCWP